jgi:hypothetical protein
MSSPLLTMFPHPDSAPWWVSGQANIIFQAHGAYHSPYEGPNSFSGRGEYKTSMLGTLYTGYAFVRHGIAATRILKTFPTRPKLLQSLLTGHKNLLQETSAMTTLFVSANPDPWGLGFMPIPNAIALAWNVPYLLKLLGI